MKEIFNIFKYTKFLGIFILSIVVYMIFFIPSKYFLFVLGYEIRIVSVFPIIFGILFGPVGALGVSFGNLFVNVLFKTDIFLKTNNYIIDFISTFLFSYISYLIWNGLGNRKLELDTALKYIKLTKVITVASIFNAFISAYLLSLFNIVDFRKILLITTINNLVVGLIFSVPIYLLIYPLLKKLSLLYEDMVEYIDISATFKESALVLIFTILVITGYFICLLLSFSNFSGIIYWILNIKVIGLIFILVIFYLIYLINKVKQ